MARHPVEWDSEVFSHCLFEVIFTNELSLFNHPLFRYCCIELYYSKYDDNGLSFHPPKMPSVRLLPWTSLGIHHPGWFLRNWPRIWGLRQTCVICRSRRILIWPWATRKMTILSKIKCMKPHSHGTSGVGHSVISSFKIHCFKWSWHRVPSCIYSYHIPRGAH